ncbi:unnamed protein product [Brachionus calyciflorus]|uniref:RRM domain-containing protein n=1 Tax=Brachionus calyciflorus TaxID=104777 RepID=A0A814FBZ6_9BILA|nr:unnamed protein product [Brachionus calyciflorus]
MLFVKVAESDAPEETVEIPIEPQGFILMSTLTAQFPGACGLKFKTEQSSWRGVRVVEDKIYPPGDDKWDESTTYIITYPKDSKRKGDDLDINIAKARKIERKCVDLIVLGIPWKSTEDVVRRYFEQYGEVVLCEIKRDSSNNSKGFGFVRFKDYNNQCSVLGKKHCIDGRWCDVKIPNSQEPEISRKIFVGRLSESLSTADLQEYFSQYGQVIDVYIPKPFRAFGFVTFVEAVVAQSLCGESHIIKGVSVHVSRADPKDDDSSHSSSHQSSHKYPHSVHNFSQLNRENDTRRFSPHHPHSQSSHLIGLIQKQPNQRGKKFESHNSDVYDRRNDIRSPNLGCHFSQQRNSGIALNASNNLPNNNLFSNSDQMAVMMNMFNPMMAAFIQQLASQSNIMPQNAQNNMDPHNSSAAVIAALGHHHNSVPSGVQQHHWNNGNAQIQGNHLSLNPNGLSSNLNYNPRYKLDKQF